jgi:hypothetical protein
MNVVNIQNATRADRIAVSDRMLRALESLKSTEDTCEVQEFVNQIRKVAEALPDLGDEYYKANHEIKIVADIVLWQIKQASSTEQ